MKHDKQKSNWIIDAALFGGFLGSLWLDLTGVAMHQWLGLGVGVLAVYHLIKHWSWVKAVTARLISGGSGHTSSQSRTFYAVDAVLAAGLATIAGTGLVISTWLDLSLASYTAWYAVHVTASIATLGLLVAKIGLHWRWIISVARRSIFPAPAPVGVTGVVQPVAAVSQVNRRDFVRLMAGVSAVALLAGVRAGAKVGAKTGAMALGETAVASTSASAASTQGASSSTTTSSSCTVHCNRRCSYPGHCRKYTDSNNNGRCDLGECLS